ncbi:MAG: thiamine phosphate synthase [Absicoccus porci]|uniref:thiamine phosphate synthase n=1 Tax=Absicoccus porci TaxID=2486576 RepID=UPI00235611AF|nr:thiamine phosphate synthase [Absicoccus porci]MCI6087298.1 thiamine phosphate synthase [Absicoccus porci]MDD7329674.1 thiamine phosphate synthase [Absicoccus porci]MDY4739351.1 thiamine phosphate synthase [Absicoccus porci]
MKSNNYLELYAVTDRHWLGNQTLLEQVQEALDGGATCIQLREKQLDDKTFLQEAIEIQKLCKQYQVPFIVNDNVEIAKDMHADGIHVGQSDMEALDVRKELGKDVILGVSAQTVEQAKKAEAHGADYLGVGAVFPTGSKDDAEDVSYETLKAICEAVSIPVIAIGGITQDNVKELAGSGIVGIAVISAIFAQQHITQATKDLKQATEQMLDDRPL